MAEIGANDAWDGTKSHIRVVMKGLTTNVQVGLHPQEQHPERPTRVIIRIEMFATLEAGLADERRDDIVDYDHIRDAIKHQPDKPHTPLLETLLAELVDLCMQNPRVEACRVCIMKPDIFNEAEAVGIEAYVLRTDHEQQRTA